MSASAVDHIHLMHQTTPDPLPESPKMTHRPVTFPVASALASRVATLLTLGALSAPALAHEGHGLPGAAHWHATDVLGFVAVAALVAGVIWFKGRK